MQEFLKNNRQKIPSRELITISLTYYLALLRRQRNSYFIFFIFKILAKKSKNSLLWQISGENLSGTSYIFGTMHVKDERAFSLIEPLKDVIDTCEAFATEFNLKEAESGVEPNAMDLPDNQILTDFISEKKYQRMRKIFIKYFEFDIEVLKSAMPLIISNALSAQTLMSEREVNLDQYLWQYAESQEKITLGIETFAEQLQILHAIPLDYQFKALSDISKNISSFSKQHQKMTALYAKQDIRQMYQSTKKSIGAARKILLYNRNEIMAERIERMAQEQTLFTAVGAAHLAGKKGVLKLLKNAGLSVKPIKLKN